VGDSWWTCFQQQCLPNGVPRGENENSIRNFHHNNTNGNLTVTTRHCILHSNISKLHTGNAVLRNYLRVVLMFCWPWISIHLCNKNQLDAIFIPSLFRQPTSTCFGHICSPSSGGSLYIYNTYQLLYIQGVTGGKDQTSGGCSLC